MLKYGSCLVSKTVCPHNYINIKLNNTLEDPFFNLLEHHLAVELMHGADTDNIWWGKDISVQPPEQYAVLQHAPLATLIEKSASLNVSGLARPVLPRWQGDLDQVDLGVIWRVSAVTTGWYQPCSGWSPCCLAHPCNQLTGNRDACLKQIPAPGIATNKHMWHGKCFPDCCLFKIC